jgi:hypothetical protein
MDLQRASVAGHPQRPVRAAPRCARLARRAGQLPRRAGEHAATAAGRRSHAGRSKPEEFRRQAACFGRCQLQLARGGRADLSAAARRHHRPGLDVAAAVVAESGARRGLGRDLAKAGCSALPISAARGSWSMRCGTERSAPNGSAAAMTHPASIRSARIRSARKSCWSASAVAGSGSVTMMRPGGGCRPTACALTTCHRSRPTARTPRIHTASSAASLCPTCCDASITTASGAAATTRAAGSHCSRCRCRTSALRWRRIRRSRTRPGSCLPRPINAACRWMARWSSTARATPAAASRRCVTDCRSPTVTTWSTVMAWRSDRTVAHC